MNKTDYAIQYAKKGLFVISLRENSKIPTMKHKDQPALSADQLRLIFDQHPEFNIGVKTVDLFVIDVDSQQHGNDNVDGFASLKNIPDDLLPTTLMETSPTGGKHYFYLKRNGKPRKSFPWREGVDVVAGKNNLTVVPPSTKNGKPYEWLNPEHEIVTAPQGLIDLIEHDYQQKHSDKTIKVDYSLINGKRWTGKLLDELIQGSNQGQRNTYLTSLVGKLFATGADARTIYQLLIFANEHCEPPLPDDEVITIYNSILERELRKHENS